MKVAVYSTKTCPFCKMEKDFLKEKGIVFENFFVDEDEKKAKIMIKKSGQMGVPVTVIVRDGGEEKVIVGFDKDALKKALSL